MKEVKRQAERTKVELGKKDVELTQVREEYGRNATQNAELESKIDAFTVALYKLPVLDLDEENRSLHQ